MATAAKPPIICSSPDGPQRVVLNFAEGTVTFEHCHEPRKFLAVGCEALHVCPFSDLRAAHDFLSGEAPGRGIRAVLGLGHVTGLHQGGQPLESMFISTASGRSRVFAHWHGYAEFRSAIRELCHHSPGGQWADEPRLMPVYAVVLLAIVGGIIWALL